MSEVPLYSDTALPGCCIHVGLDVRLPGKKVLGSTRWTTALFSKANLPEKNDLPFQVTYHAGFRGNDRFLIHRVGWKVT